MDDLEYSVLIAEQDWKCFCEESEECSIQQALLAGLDDSGLSDTDDDKRSTKEPVLPLQTNPDKPSKEQGAAAQIQDKAVDCDVRAPESEDSECFSCETDRGCLAEQSAQSRLSNNTATHADFSISGSAMAAADHQHNTSDTESVKYHSQCLSEGNFRQATQEVVPITPAPNIHTGSPEVTVVMGDSAPPQKEKERWFVTVNDSPVHLRIHHGTPGQKKKKKKKRSRKIAEESRVRDNGKEGQEEMNVGGEGQDKSQQPLQRCSEYLYFSRLHGDGNKEVISDSSIMQKVVLSPLKQPEVDDCEKSSVTSINCNLAVHPIAAKVRNLNYGDGPTDKPENYYSMYLNSPTPQILAHSLQLQIGVLNGSQLSYDQSTANQRDSNTDITTHNRPVTNVLCHVHDATGESRSGFTLTSSVTVPLDKTYQEKEYLTHFDKKEKHHFPSVNQEPTDESLETAVSPSHPIYALSSFWDEMEKLTINDILHVREDNNKFPLKENVHPEKMVNPEESDIQDRCLVNSKDGSVTDDTTDSDYFTHFDDSKPDCSSCELSAFSDFDEEYLQIFDASANHSSEHQNVKDSTNVQELLHEQELELMINNKTETEDDTMLCSLVGIPFYPRPAAEAQSSVLVSDQDSSERPFGWEAFRKAPSPVLSVANTLDEQSLLTLSEIFAKDIEELESPNGHSSVISFPYSKNLSVSETYDDFFIDFEIANLFFPSVQDKTIPIFSSSHSVVRDVVLPEVEELSESDTENENSRIQVMTRFSSQPERSTSHSPNFYFFTNQRRNWRSFFSLRRIRLIGTGSAWCQKISSWIFPQEAKKETSYVSKVQPMSPLLPLEGKALAKFVEHQEHLQNAVSISKREESLFSIGHADLCLVCIAFASWVLKSSNPQTADMWKTALLANVSAVSAIQYLRQYVKRERTNYDP